MNPSRKKIALERMYILVKTAISNARSDPSLAEKQANLARRISTHYRLSLIHI